MAKRDLDLNNSPSLPMGSSTQGVTSGSLGGVSMSALKTGFDSDKNDFDPSAESVYGPNDNGGGTPVYVSPELVPSGFLGRPNGWQR